jgi:hypothetical protein
MMLLAIIASLIAFSEIFGALVVVRGLDVAVAVLGELEGPEGALVSVAALLLLLPLVVGGNGSAARI